MNIGVTMDGIALSAKDEYGGFARNYMMPSSYLTHPAAMRLVDPYRVGGSRSAGWSIGAFYVMIWLDELRIADRTRIWYVYAAKNS